MKLREVVYWVVILLQVILLTGVKEKELSCWCCEKKGTASQMLHQQAYGWFHPECMGTIPDFDEDCLELPIRIEGDHTILAQTEWQ